MVVLPQFTTWFTFMLVFLVYDIRNMNKGGTLYVYFDIEKNSREKLFSIPYFLNSLHQRNVVTCEGFSSPNASWNRSRLSCSLQLT